MSRYNQTVRVRFWLKKQKLMWKDIKSCSWRRKSDGQRIWENPTILLNRKRDAANWEKGKSIHSIYWDVQWDVSLRDLVTLLPRCCLWFIPCMGEKRGVVPWVGCSPSAGCCQLLVSCFLTNCLCWSYAGQSWKQCAPGHFLYGDFREKQNWKTSHNTQVVLFVFFSFFPLKGLWKNPLIMRIIYMS